MQQVATSNKEELTRETTVKAKPAVVSAGEALKKENINFFWVFGRTKDYFRSHKGLLDHWKDQLIGENEANGQSGCN